MKKLALMFLGVWSSTAMAEAVYYGTVNGSIRDYYPNIHITNVRSYNATATSGANGEIYDRAGKNSNNLISQLIEEGKGVCKSEQGYFIDNLNVTHTPFGDFHNIFTVVSANITCFNKEK